MSQLMVGILSLFLWVCSVPVPLSAQSLLVRIGLPVQLYTAGRTSGETVLYLKIRVESGDAQGLFQW